MTFTLPGLRTTAQLPRDTQTKLASITVAYPPNAYGGKQYVYLSPCDDVFAGPVSERIYRAEIVWLDGGTFLDERVSKER